jgi:hypothetical protein
MVNHGRSCGAQPIGVGNGLYAVCGFRSAIRHFLLAPAGSYLNDWDIR